MLSIGSRSGTQKCGTQAVTIVQQTRNISKRRIAYPTYPFKKLSRQDPKKHDTNLKYAMRQFLGPKNYKGEYALNKYTMIPTDHVPNYIKPLQERGRTLINPVNGAKLQETAYGKYEEIPALNDKYRDSKTNKRDNILQPFPLNPYCKTNYMVPDELKLQIYDDIENKGLSTQEVSHAYGLKIPRVEAILKLMKIEQRWENKNMVNDNMQRMSKALYGMFPLFKPDHTYTRENLSEIPVPPKTLKSRFVTIAESEPFGPVDAANVLELEPAMKTLERLSAIAEHSDGHLEDKTTEKKKNKIVVGELRKGDRSRLVFKDVKAENVAYRYGAGNRDNKKDRRIGFNERGHMVYI